MNDIVKFIPYYCHKILPLVYDDSLSYYEVLAKVTKKLNETIDEMNNFTTINQLTWGGTWSGANNYGKWVIVTDPVSLNGYVSLQFVPAGIMLDNTEYWGLVFEYDKLYGDFIRRMDSIEQDTQEMIDNAEEQFNALVEQAEEDVNSVSIRISSVEQEQAVLDARMDEFTTLAEGSTTGDAELADIRVGYDGTTYTSAGDAVRAQGNTFSDEIDMLNETVFEVAVLDWSSIGNTSYPYGFRTGFYTYNGAGDGGVAASSSHYLRSIKKVGFDKYKIVHITAPEGMSFAIYDYASDGTFIDRYGTYGVYTDPSDGTNEYTLVPTIGHRYNFVLSGWQNQPEITASLVNGWVAKMYAPKASDDRCIVQYESGSFGNGIADARISVYVPSDIGYILYRLYHYNIPADNCVCWGIYHVYSTTPLLSQSGDLTVTGEWEFAGTVEGTYIGGRTHGNERDSTVTFLIDGQKVTTTEMLGQTSCNNFKIIKNSVLYDPTNTSQAVAKHGTEYEFYRSEMILRQSIKWLNSRTVGNCFMNMFLPNKNCLDRAACNNDFEVIELPSSTATAFTDTIVKENANYVAMWDTSTGISASVDVTQFPTGYTGGNRVQFDDNNGLDYNKVYFKVCSSADVDATTLWKTTAKYKIDRVI